MVNCDISKKNGTMLETMRTPEGDTRGPVPWPLWDDQSDFNLAAAVIFGFKLWLEKKQLASATDATEKPPSKAIGDLERSVFFKSAKNFPPAD